MRTRTILVSAALHAGLAVFALRAATTSGNHDAIEVTIAAPKTAGHENEPKPEPKTPEPVEAPRAAPARPRAAAPAPEPAPEPEPAATAPRHLETNIEMGNNPDGPGPGVPIRGGPPSPAGEPAHVAPPAPEPPPKEKVLVAPKPASSADDCAEAATKPVPVSRPTSIEYTSQARADGAEGRLVLAISVGPDGGVTGVQVKSGVHPSIDAAASTAVRAWHFTPAMRCGKPVEGTYTLARRFELGD